MSLSGDEIRYPQLTRKGRKYYRMDEVNRHLNRIAEDAQSERNQLDFFRAQNRELLNANQKQTATISAFREKIAGQENSIEEQVREISELGEQLNLYRNENVSQSERIAQQAMQIARLQTKADNLNEQIRLLESQNSDEILQEAIRKADEIVGKAIADSDRILLQSTEQRGRLIAACRAAYYSALQFKQDLADQFRNMERELDASIDVLQLMDNSRLALTHNAEVTEPAPNPGTVLP